MRSATGASNGGIKRRGPKPVVDFMSDQAHGLKALKTRAVKREDYSVSGYILVVSDIHFPYHDPGALELAIQHGVDAGCETLLVNGDLLDFYKLSRFIKDPTETNVCEELEMAKQFFDLVAPLFSKIVYKLGNHEDRLEHYLWSKAPELIGLPFTTLGALIDNEKVEIVGSRQLMKAGRLNIVHGHEFGTSVFNPVNPARGLFLRSKCSTMAGHHHQTSEHHENNVNGDAMACWSTGCLCDLSPTYSPFAFTKWNHGFATVETEPSGEFTVRNCRIIGGKVH